MSFDVHNNREFTEAIIKHNYFLDEAVDWIKNNLCPEDIFDESELGEWALNNGYTAAED